MEHPNPIAAACARLGAYDQIAVEQYHAYLKEGRVTYGHRLLDKWVKSASDVQRPQRQEVSCLLKCQFPARQLLS